MSVAPVQSSLNVKDQVSAAEWQTRVDLAACYRLVALHGWDDLIFTHLSARVPGPEHHFLILNMYSLSFSSMIAANLVKSNFKEVNNAEHGELYLVDRFKKNLPLGIFFRFRS